MQSLLTVEAVNWWEGTVLIIKFKKHFLHFRRLWLTRVDATQTNKVISWLVNYIFSYVSDTASFLYDWLMFFIILTELLFQPFCNIEDFFL